MAKLLSSADARAGGKIGGDLPHRQYCTSTRGILLVKVTALMV